LHGWAEENREKAEFLSIAR